MTNIRYVDLQRIVAIVELLHPNGIVEIARRLAVYCDNLQPAKIAATRQFRLRNLLHNCPRFVNHRLRKPVRDMMLTDHDFDVDAEIILMPQDLDDPPHRVPATLRKFEDLHIDDHVVHLADVLHHNCGSNTHAIQILFLPRDLHPFHNVDPSRQLLIERSHITPVPPHMKLAHHRRMRALQHLNDFPIAAPVRIHPPYPHHHHVPVHRLQCGLPRNVDIVDERVAVLVDAQRPHRVLAR